MATKQPKNKTHQNSHAVNILAYFIVGLLWYVIDKPVQKDAFVTFHVKQALNLLIFSIGVSIAGNIPFIGWYIIGPLGGLFIFVLWLFGLIYAIQKEKKEVPLIGSLAERYLTF